MSEPDEKAENTNCLEGMRCPNPDCRSYGPFEIAVETVVLVYDEGTGDQLSDTEWDEDSYCGCRECWHSGTVGSFRTENQNQEEKS